MASETAPRGSLRESLLEYGRGIAGGLLFSLPLIYTMEVWWTGFIASPERLLVYVGATFLLLLGYNRYAGLREDASFLEVIIDSVEELGLGLLVSLGFLWLLGRVSSEMPAQEVIGKVIVEGMTVAIGVSVGTAQLGAKGGSGTKGRKRINFLGEAVIALCGAVLIAANVAPTEEIMMLAIENTSANMLGIVALSLAVMVVVLRFSDFRGSSDMTEETPVPHLLFSLVVSYAVSLLASAFLLWFFDRFGGMALIVCVSQVVVLAFAASLGASAGRLLLRS